MGTFTLPLEKPCNPKYFGVYDMNLYHTIFKTGLPTHLQIKAASSPFYRR